MLVVENLTCRFGTKAAVDNASFDIAPGAFVGVIGRSGAGKSTLLRMINRLAEPTSGRISFEGVDVTALRGRDLRQLDRPLADAIRQMEEGADGVTGPLREHSGQMAGNRSFFKRVGRDCGQGPSR